MEVVIIQLYLPRNDLEYSKKGRMGGSLSQSGNFEGQKNVSFKCYNVLCNIALKNNSLKMATTGGRNM
jgi:hypothetical protein